MNTQNEGKTNITLEDIRNDLQYHMMQNEQDNESKGMLLVKPANTWMEQAKNRPAPKLLFGEFWLEGEICILFADTNLGKSILAVQVCDSISTGSPITGFRLDAGKQKVLYFDFELSDKQFETRYSIDFAGHYAFDNNFLRVEIDPEAIIPDTENFEDYLVISLERSVTETGAKILVIDNITYLKNETEKAKDALPLMKKLKELKSRYGLSVLVLAHTPKRDLSKPITRNDLSGSKMLINFCDSAFSIGESHTDKNLRYLKQIKARNTEIIYDADNVCLCQIIKPGNFLLFEFLNFGAEWEHLREVSEKDRENLIEKVMQLKHQRLSLREIGLELGISHMKVSRIIKDCNTL